MPSVLRTPRRHIWHSVVLLITCRGGTLRAGAAKNSRMSRYRQGRSPGWQRTCPRNGRTAHGAESHSSSGSGASEKEAATGARRAFEKAVEAAEATYAERAAPFESARHDAMLLVLKVRDELMTPDLRAYQEAIALAQRCRDEAVADAERVYEETVEPAQLALQEARISASAVLERTMAAIQRALDEKHISAREFEEAMAEADPGAGRGCGGSWPDGISTTR